jgi:microcystin-dependent protein
MASQPYLGEIRMFAGNFAPFGWALCNGQIMSIQQNTALFSLLGTMYGGNGQTTFALPDLQGRVPIHQGQSTFGTNYNVGEIAGSESVTLTDQEMPAHTHAVSVAAIGTTDSPVNGYPATDPAGNVAQFKANTTANAAMNANAVRPTGGSQPHANIQPTLAVTYIIALTGVYPSRN